MKCRRCKAPAVVEIRRHNASFCRECFVRHVQEQVKRAIGAYDMFGPTDRLLVAVSGGKDSLALWDVLLDLGYRASGLYLGLGIGEYSSRSGDLVRAFAQARSAELLEVDLANASVQSFLPSLYVPVDNRSMSVSESFSLRIFSCTDMIL